MKRATIEGPLVPPPSVEDPPLAERMGGLILFLPAPRGEVGLSEAQGRRGLETRNYRRPSSASPVGRRSASGGTDGGLDSVPSRAPRGGGLERSSRSEGSCITRNYRRPSSASPVGRRSASGGTDGILILFLPAPRGEVGLSEAQGRRGSSSPLTSPTPNPHPASPPHASASRRGCSDTPHPAHRTSDHQD